MEVPSITGTGPVELNGTTADTARFRAELQQLGTGLRSDTGLVLSTNSIPSDIVELAETSAIPYDLLSQVFRTLGTALQSGSLTNSQSAYWTLQHMMAEVPQFPDQAFASQRVILLAEAFAHLRQAVQSGDLSSAQQAYQTMRLLLQNAAPSPDRVPTDPRSQAPLEMAWNEQGKSARTDQSFNAQQAYWAIQQELRTDSDLSRLHETPLSPTSSPDAYSIYLLIAANQLSGQSGGPAHSLFGHKDQRIGISVWWIVVNLTLVFFGVVTGLVQMSPSALVLAALSLLVVNTLAFLGVRAFSNRD